MHFQLLAIQHSSGTPSLILVMKLTVLQMYYYVSTFKEEVAHIWPQRRFGLGKTLFLTTRYMALSTMIAQLLGEHTLIFGHTYTPRLTLVS